MAASNGASVTLMAGGDIGPIVEPTGQFAELIAPVLKQADLRFGQCERTYSQRGADPQYTDGPGGRQICRAPLLCVAAADQFPGARGNVGRNSCRIGEWQRCNACERSGRTLAPSLGWARPRD